MGHFDRIIMHLSRITLGLLAISLAVCVPAAAQLSPAEPDPLARIRDAAKSNVQACSATGETLCEQVAPKIIANAEGESPLAEDLRTLAEILKGHQRGISKESPAVEWALAAFRNAGVEAHTERYDVPAAGSKGKLRQQENLVAEIRGREEPDEWVLVGAHLDSWPRSPKVVNYSCDAAAVIEAARDISRTAIRPRRSIRFVLFTGDENAMIGSWAFARSHRAELDGARAAIVLNSSCLKVTGYVLNGRHDIEIGVREAMKPIEFFGASNYAFGALLGPDDFDFVLEGVPTLTGFPLSSLMLDPPTSIGRPDKLPIKDLRRNTEIVAVTAFGIAERAEPIGPRQSRAEIESLLKTTGLDEQRKNAGLWLLWESGKRGRVP
jgi:hypothetical protein